MIVLVRAKMDGDHNFNSDVRLIEAVFQETDEKWNCSGIFDVIQCAEGSVQFEPPRGVSDHSHVVRVRFHVLANHHSNSPADAVPCTPIIINNHIVCEGSCLCIRHLMSLHKFCTGSIEMATGFFLSLPLSSGRHTYQYHWFRLVEHYKRFSQAPHWIHVMRQRRLKYCTIIHYVYVSVSCFFFLLWSLFCIQMIMSVSCAGRLARCNRNLWHSVGRICHCKPDPVMLWVWTSEFDLHPMRCAVSSDLYKGMSV